jgi:Plavaka transposase
MFCVNSVTIPYDVPTEIPAPSAISLTTDQAVNASSPLRSSFLQYFRTAGDFFGLSRRYYGTERPSHDPEDHITSEDLCDTVSQVDHFGDHSSNNQPFYPYPNPDSFALGEWYWNQGVQKSKEGFLQLIKIVGDPNFTPSDVHSTNWDKINTILASNAGDSDPNDYEWLGEDKGWNCTAFSIRVPFHRRMAIPGPQRYLAGELYHRSIVSVIRERVKSDDTYFHYEPYELLWKSTSDAEEVRIHGELYTSAIFLSEHKKLLESPGEPGCDAPRAIVALMFWSDATHLTSFGNAKLWPCYMFFGNDSKYRRAKPSHHLGNHIAYFQTVRPPVYVY